MLEEEGRKLRGGDDLSIGDRDAFCMRDVYFRRLRLVRVGVFMSEKLHKTIEKKENERDQNKKEKKSNLPSEG